MIQPYCSARQMEIGAQHGRERGERLTVQIIDGRGEATKTTQDQPSGDGTAVCSLDGSLELDGGHFARGREAGIGLREIFDASRGAAFCTPQPSVLLRAVEMAILAGSAPVA